VSDTTGDTRSTKAGEKNIIMSSLKKFTNRLIHETSPYLLQHAHNPVDWYAWGDEALQKAKDEDKPVLVSIGYSACHWCHVMEKESFEDESTAEIMNKYFINIKIDREERPDLDHIYMDAVQAITGSGGWPLNVFLTPDAKPFYGGTYFPPVRAYNRMSWKETLLSIHESYKEKRSEIESQAENLTQHIFNANSFGINKPATQNEDSFFSENSLNTIAANILQNGDKEWGGFGNAPKFPQTFCIQYLLRHYHFTKDQPSLDQALLSLDKMMQGGIYDHLGGGFARYSTDTKWLAPHFEKMLYDNALLVGVLAEAFQLTGDHLYAECIKETLDFIKREMSSAEGAFYSALDADSEGVEGKYYVWSKQEVDELLQEDAEIFSFVYNISEKGNWEHVNILWLPQSLKTCAAALNMEENILKEKLGNCKRKLFAFRNKRIRPGLDDKILLGWNALMITACCKAYASAGELQYLKMATDNIRFIENNFIDEEGNWFHTWKNGQAKYPAFLDDFAFLIQAYIQLQEVTGDSEYLLSARNLTETVIKEFSDDDFTFFWFTKNSQRDVIVRKKEIYDGAVPSGNAVMAHNLIYLSVVFDIAEWRQRVENMTRSLNNVILRYSSSFGNWALLVQLIVKGFNEIVIIGAEADKLLKEVNNLFVPGKIIQSAIFEDHNFPLLRNKWVPDETYLYLCKDYNCLRPVKKTGDLILLLKN